MGLPCYHEAGAKQSRCTINEGKERRHGEGGGRGGSGVLKAGTSQSSYTARSILEMGNKCTICGGKRPKNVNVVTKIGGKNA